MFKKWLLVLAATVLSVAIFAGLFELVASYRYDGWREAYAQNGDLYDRLTVASDNEILLWEYRPNSVGRKLDVEIKTNEHGFRDVSHALQKPVNRFRIAFVGDSVTQGIGVEAESTFVSQFSKMAQSSPIGADIETLSFSVDAYTGIQVMEMARKKAIPFSPDLIVYIMCMNDADLDRASGKKIKYFKKPESFFLRFIEKTYAKYLGGDYYEHAFRTNGQAVLADIIETKKLLAEKGIDFRVVLMPVFQFDDPVTEYPLKWLHTEIATTLSDNGVATIDLQSLLGEDVPLEAYGLDAWHLNPAGHREVAVTLFEQLLQRPTPSASSPRPPLRPGEARFPIQEPVRPGAGPAPEIL